MIEDEPSFQTADIWLVYETQLGGRWAVGAPIAVFGTYEGLARKLPEIMSKFHWGVQVVARKFDD